VEQPLSIAPTKSHLDVLGKQSLFPSAKLHEQIKLQPHRSEIFGLKSQCSLLYALIETFWEHLDLTPYFNYQSQAHQILDVKKFCVLTLCLHNFSGTKSRDT